MKKLVLLLFTINGFGQMPNIEWQKSFSGAGNDYGLEIIQTADSGYAFVGTSDTAGHGNSDMLITKIDAQGNQQWRKFYGGSDYDYGTSIKQTSDDGYIVAGFTHSNNGNVVLNRGWSDAWILKLNALGEIQWQKTYGGTDADIASSILQTQEGGYIFLGFSDSTNGDHTESIPAAGDWVVKLSSNGTIEWQKTLNGSALIIKKIKKTLDNAYIIGSSGTTANGTSVNTDAIITKIDVQGNILFQENYGGSKNDLCSDIIQTDDLGFLVVGSSYSNDGDVSGHHAEVSGWETNDAWAFKINPLGEIEWQKSLGGSDGDSFDSIKKDSDGGYTLLGLTSSIDGDVTANHGIWDAWMVKLDGLGIILGQKCFGGTSMDRGFNIIPTNDGYPIMVGASFSNDGDVTQSLGGGDAWIIKFGPQLALNNFDQDKFLVYPNPAKNQINFQLPMNLAVDKITITDLCGKTILTHTGITNQINTENLSNGVYFVHAYSGKNVYQTKFIKN